MFSTIARAPRWAPAAGACLMIGAAWATPANAQLDTAPQAAAVQAPRSATAPLSRLFEAAWRRLPVAAAESARLAAAQAQLDSARRLTPEPASVGLAHRTDQPTRNEGRREYELELSVPLWLPGQRDATMRAASNESQLAALAVQLERLKLAQEVRQRWWGLVLAANAATLERRRVVEAQQLAADAQRRLKVGDVARSEVNQAQSLVQRAVSAALDAEQLLDAQLSDLRVLTGWSDADLIATVSQGDWVESSAADSAPSEHPELAVARLNQALTRAKLSLAAATSRANPSVSIGVIRERDAFGEVAKSTLRLGVSIPLGAGAAALAQTEGARAAALESDAALPLVSARLDAQRQIAATGLQRAVQSLQAAEQRVALARDSSTLAERAHRLGEIDMATRLRIEAELFEAQRNLIQAQAQRGRAQSDLNQSFGLLP